MKQLFITEVEQSLLSILDNAQLLEMFLSAKRVEGCSEKTLHYYQTTIAKLLHTLDKRVVHIPRLLSGGLSAGAFAAVSTTFAVFFPEVENYGR